jgi:arylsulfatase A-like enzyme
MQNLANKPNILLLTIDTLRADMLSCYGYPEQLTPNIDRLAAKGVRFNQAITGGSWTQAAFPVIMTSTYASMYGGCLGPLSPARPSPIEALEKGGYITGGFSTSPLLSRKYGYDRGFKYFVDLPPGERDPWLRRLKGGERLLRLPAIHHLAGLAGKRMRPARLYVPAEKLVEDLGNWILGNSQPFFAWAHFMDIHWPYHLEDSLDTPGRISQAWQDMGHLHRVNWNGASINEKQRSHYLDLYKQAVRYTDFQIGRLIDKLTEFGLLDNTAILLISDHGEEFLERGRWGHFETNLYDEILHVPFIFYSPGIEGGKVVERQVRTLDIMPTILDLCGCECPKELEGISLIQYLEDNQINSLELESISEMWRNNRHIVAIRSEAFKYIWDNRHPADAMLFELSADPEELNNVIARYPALTKEFHNKLEAHLQQASDKNAFENIAEPELEAEMLSRLRDLGYVE